MAGETVQYVDSRSFDVVDYSRLPGHLFYVAGYAVLHVLSRRGILHLLKVLDELRFQVLPQVSQFLSSRV